MSNVVGIGRHGQPGYFSLRQLPQRPSIEQYAISTGWPELDEIWKPYEGQFNVVTGLAGSGKSTFLLNVICNLAHEKGVRSFMFVPENEGHIHSKLRSIWGERDGFDYFAEEQCYVQSATPDDYSDPARTLHWVLDMARAGIENDHVGLLLIDPWNELEWAKPKDMLLSEYIGACLKDLKQFCRAYSVTIIMVAHPTKAGVEKGKIPSLADIEGSMNWFNKCDNGLIVHRPDNTATTQVISAKVRERGAGRRGTCFFSVDTATERFTPISSVTP